MRTMILCSLGGDRPGAALQVKLAPSYAADFRPPLAQKHEEFQDATKCIIAGCFPNGGKLAVGQSPIARWWRLGAGGADDGVSLYESVG